MTVQHPSHRGSILLEEAEVLGHEAWPGEQYILRLHAPRCAARATAGSFVHLTCDPDRPMRRPLSIQHADPTTGVIEILYKVVGQGLTALARAAKGDRLSCLGPIGQPFRADPTRPRSLLIGGGVGMPPILFLAETMHEDTAAAYKPLVLLGSEIPFPFMARPSTLLLPEMPDAVIAAHPHLESLGIPSRLATMAGFAGCFPGYVTDLARHWLGALTPGQRAETAIYACGPTPMLAACAQVAHEFGVPAQVSLEEFMACAVGGCAGCAIEVTTPTGKAMKRVCVDGPVFDAAAVFPPAS
jgi:dihydroorotate dehydrogenase electron transfer subunit